MKVHFGRIAHTVLVPTLPQVVASLGLALLLEVITYRSLLTHRLATVLDIPESSFGQGSESAFYSFTNAPMLSQVASLGFWALIGLAIYGATLFVRNALVSTHNTVLIENEFTDRPSQTEMWLRSVERFCIAMILVLAGAVLAFITLPFLIGISGSALFDGGGAGALESISGYLGLSACIYFVWMLFTCALHTGDLG